MKNPYNQEIVTQQQLQEALNEVPGVVGVILQSEKGSADGVAPLDSSLPTPQVPEQYIYNANTRLNSLEDYQGHDKGIYTTSTALITAYPTASAGDFAYVQATSSRWIWEATQWIDTEQDIKDNFLNKNNFLSEFDDATKKLNARENLSVYSKEQVDIVEAKIKPQNGFTDRTKSALSLVGLAFTISPNPSYTIFVKGKKFDITTNYSVSISNTVGLHYIYFDETNGTLELKSTLSPTKDLFTSYAYVSNLYWNGSSATLDIQDERHGTNMDGDSHFYNHATFGTVFRSGLVVSLDATGNGNLDSHAQFSCSSGVIADEDNIFDISSKTLTSQFPLIYRLGTTWVEDITNFIVKTTGTGRAAFNQNVAGSYQLSEIPNNDFGICYVIAGTSYNASKRIFVLMGSQSFTTLQNARTAVEQRPDLSGLPFQEFKLVAGIIYQTSTSYTNAVKTRIVTIDGTIPYVDWRRVLTQAEGANPTSSDLANLQDQISVIDGRVDQIELDYVKTSSNQTINGIKTFVSYPEKQGTYLAPTTDLQLVPKKYVDDKVAGEDNWNRSGTDLTPTNAGDNINLGTGGLKDSNVSTAIKLGDSTNTSFSTTNKTIVGSVNELDTEKANKIVGGIQNNLVKIGATGDIEDALTSVQDLIDLEDSYFNLPAYQDFTNVTGTSLTLTVNSNCFLENGTPAPQNITNNALIVSNSATATLTSNPEQYPRTNAFSSIKLVSSVITASNTNQTITLSGTPRTADKDNIRIYFVIRCKRKDVPVVYNEFPKNVRVSLQSLDTEGMATDDEVKALIDGTQTTVTKYVSDINSSDTNNGNTIFAPYQTLSKAWTDITSSGQVKVQGASTYNVSHTFASSKSSIKTILEGGTKITGTIGFVIGNTSMQFIGGKFEATINDASTGTQYWNGVDLSGSTINFTGGGYKQITNSSSTPALINLSNLASGSGTLELNNIIGGIVPISVGTGWTVLYRNTITTTVGAVNGVVVEANNAFVNAVITSQSALDAIAADGYYILNFSNPVISGQVVSKGDVIYRVGSSRIVVYKFSFAPATFAVLDPSNPAQRFTWFKSIDGWVQVGAPSWGAITGTLSTQTDLQNALNAKADQATTYTKTQVDNGLATKEWTITAGTTSQYYRGDKTFQTLDKTAVGLGNVDNTSDASKPISTATQAALSALKNETEILTNKTINSDQNNIILKNVSFDTNSTIANDDPYGVVAGKLQAQINSVAPPIIRTVTADTTLAKNERLMVNSSSMINLTLDPSPTIGSVYPIVGIGSGLFRIVQNASQSILIPSADSVGVTTIATSTGTSGFVLAPQSKFACELQFIGNGQFLMIKRNVDDVEIDNERWSRATTISGLYEMVTPHGFAFLNSSQVTSCNATLRSTTGEDIIVTAANQFSTAYAAFLALAPGCPRNSNTARLMNTLDSRRGTPEDWYDFAFMSAPSNAFFIVDFSRPIRCDILCIQGRGSINEGPNAGWTLHGTNNSRIIVNPTFSFTVTGSILTVPSTSNLEVGMFVFEVPTASANSVTTTSLGFGRYISEILSGTTVRIGGTVGGINYGDGIVGSNRTVTTANVLVFQQFNEFANNAGALTHASRIISNGPSCTPIQTNAYKNVIDLSSLHKRYKAYKFFFPTMFGNHGGIGLEMHSLK